MKLDLRKNLVVLFAVLISSGIVFPVTPIALGFPNEPTEFRGMAWGTPINQLPGMRFLAEDGDLRFYERENDPMKLEEVPVDRIVYGFHKQRFFSVMAYFSSLANFLTLKDALSKRHGEPFRPSETPNRYFWSGENVELLLLYDENTMSGRMSYFYKPMRNEAEGKQ